MSDINQKIADVLREEDKLLIIIRPDPDAMASALALSCLCRPYVSAVKVAGTNRVTRMENRLMKQMLKIRLADFSKINLQDFSKFAMVDGQPGHFKGMNLPKMTIVIDHHPDEGAEADLKMVKTGYGAASTILAELLEEANQPINRRLATALCYGIKTDTNNFERAFTKRDAAVFGRLFALADARALMNINKWEIPKKALSHIVYALEHISIKHKRLIMYIGQLERYDDLVIIADLLNSVEGVSLCAVGASIGAKLVIVLRESGLTHNVGAIASKSFGDIGSAGGHRSLARAEIPFANLDFNPLHSNHQFVEDFLREKMKGC